MLLLSFFHILNQFANPPPKKKTSLPVYTWTSNRAGQAAGGPNGQAKHHGLDTDVDIVDMVEVISQYMGQVMKNHRSKLRQLDPSGILPTPNLVTCFGAMCKYRLKTSQQKTKKFPPALRLRLMSKLLRGEKVLEEAPHQTSCPAVDDVTGHSRDLNTGCWSANPPTTPVGNLQHSCLENGPQMHMYFDIEKWGGIFHCHARLKLQTRKFLRCFFPKPDFSDPVNHSLRQAAYAWYSKEALISQPMLLRKR